MQKLLIVDGSNLLFQMFCGMPARILNRHGKAIQGTLGFTGALLKILRMTNPTHVAVLFDGECSNERRELDADYKANRETPPEDDNPFTQLPDVYRVLDYLQIPHAETTCCEFDDWAAAYALNRQPDTQVIIVSQDSDFFQLICENVQILRYRGDRSVLCDRTYIREKLGIAPEQYADFKSLTGDTADNIRGAEKVGPKTAAALLQQFGDLNTILSHVDAIGKPSIRASVSKSADRLRLNYRLIKLSGQATQPFSMNELTYTPTELTTSQILTHLDLR